MTIPFDNSYVKLPEHFYARQLPSQVPSPRLIAVNRALAESLGIDGDWLASAEGLAVLSGNEVAAGSEPIAQGYAGHQFGHFVPQLGDGRAILLGEVVDKGGRRFDIQLKGSGRTPFSRAGDGKSALGPVVREYIVSEAMAALGVKTTRALAAVVTGETVYRQEGEVAGGVFTRVASSHIRVGTFQYFHARGDEDGIRALADYVIDRHYPEALKAENRYLGLLDSVLSGQASLIAHWMSLGFIHGVMNTDNMAVSGETIDFGPCAFMEQFHPSCVFSSIDRNARYAWGNQGNIGLWNLTRFAETLLPLLDENPDAAIRNAESALDRFPGLFGEAYVSRFSAKLGVSSAVSNELIQETLQLLATQEVDFTLFFRHLTAVAGGDDKGALAGLFRDPAAFDQWFSKWKAEPIVETGVQKMKAANPVLIPRNHRVEHAIQAAYRGDYSVFERLVAAYRQPYLDRAEFADLEALPRAEEVVHQTFCGT